MGHSQELNQHQLFELKNNPCDREDNEGRLNVLDDKSILSCVARKNRPL